MMQCKVCFKTISESNFVSFFRKDLCLCYECYSKLKPLFKLSKYKGFELLTIYKETTKLTELLFNFECCGDYELKDVFLNYYIHALRLKYKGYYLVPLSSKNVNVNGMEYNPIEEVFSSLLLKKFNHDKTGQTKEFDVLNEKFKAKAQHMRILIVANFLENLKQLDFVLNNLNKIQVATIKIFVLCTKETDIINS
jgi:hypothetical protein